jgi:Phage integrase family
MPLLFQRRFGMENRAINAGAIRTLLDGALAATGLTGADGEPLRFIPHDFRRIFVTDAVMNGMPPHIAQFVCGHANINTTMGYKAVYPEEVITAHRAFIARRRATRPGEEYRTPTDAEWEEFLGHFERRKVGLGTCGRAYGTSCIHEHACIRCSLLRPDPAGRDRLVEVRDNLVARIAEAKGEGWLGEVEGLEVSLAGAREKLSQLDQIASRRTVTDLGIPTFADVAGRNVATS